MIVLAILGIVLAAMTQLFVSGTKAQVDQTNRFIAQQQGRLALDALRREIHCASHATPTGSYPTTMLTIDLGSWCPGAPVVTPPAVTAPVYWCTQAVSASRYALWRYVAAPTAGCGVAAGGVKKADYLFAPGWSGRVFSAFRACDATGIRSTLGVDLPVDASPATTGGLYRLRDDIVLRNSDRTGLGC